MRPRVYHRYAATGKIGGIARGDGGTLGAGGGGNLAIGEADWAARGAVSEAGAPSGPAFAPVER